jgi:hypothetical protein
MRLWADVYDATNTTRLGAGPVALRSATVKRVLDGPGTISVRLAGWEQRANDLMTPKRVLRVYTDGGGEKRLLGTMVIDEVDRSDSGQQGFAVAGKDGLSLLRNTITGLGRVYSNMSMSGVLADLAGLAGWTVNAEAALDGVMISTRFDGASVLKAIQAVVGEKGVHFRLDGNIQLAAGDFGAESGLRAESAVAAHADLYTNDKLLLIESFRETHKSNEVVNAILPLGAGDGDAVLTLAKSTRGRMVTRLGGDGRTEYWLEDAASIAEYGRIERRVDFKQIAPVTNSSSDVQNAANALDDAAWTWLGRHSTPRKQYELAVQKIPSGVQPGDKLTVNYKGAVTNLAGDVVAVESIRGTFWIVAVNESWGVEGGKLSLEISSVDEVDAGEAGIVVGAIDAVQVQGVAVKPFPFVNSYVYRREMAPSYPASVPVDITNAVMDITRCRVRLTTRPFRSNVTGAAAGGASVAGATSSGGGTHNHRMFALTSVSGFPSVSPQPYLGRESNGGAFAYVRMETNGRDLWTHDASDSHTHDVSISIPSHSHALQYGIFDDNAYPQTIRAFVNGTDQTAALGGPWGVGGGAVNAVIEISDLLKVGTLQRLHEVEFRCDGGRGEVEVTVELYGVMQTIAVS